MKGVRWVPVSLAIVGALAVLTVAMGTRRGVDGVPLRAAGAGADVWASHLSAVDRAVDANDMARASRLWRESYGVAVQSERWEPMLAAGGAAVRISRVAGPTAGFDAAARQCYLGALFRAREQQSVEGMLRVAEALAQLGDIEVATGAVRMADRLQRNPGLAPVLFLDEVTEP